ncbi:GNAT family N-acetyltransferase [Marinifilum fragile]|uniref:lipid II:glycine glycyltransferase FemX n=1 Tax=Marinifilum fragile TaxID=570161 RepID=UPI002AA60F19|nr:GNAT family N-acetyltransferase [Marinifilum fragile]
MAINTTIHKSLTSSPKFKVINDASLVNHKFWSEFVRNHPQGNVFQTPQMYAVFEETEGFVPILIVVMDDELIKGIQLAVIQQETKRNLGIFSRRAVIRGGPLIDENDKEVLKLILDEYNDLIKDKVLYTQIRNWVDTSPNKSVFLKCNYKYLDHLNILLDLNQDEEEIWSNIKNSKRHSIRKAIREGVAVKMETSESNLGNTYEILLQVYNRIKLPCPNMDFFKNCKAHFQNDPRFLVFTANWEDKTIAFRYVLAYKKVLYITYAGGLEEYYSKNANDLLNWELFLWGKENGYTVYDFAGAGSPNADYGVRTNKLRFGGKLYNPGRYQKIHQPLLFYFVKVAFFLRRKLLLKKT